MNNYQKCAAKDYVRECLCYVDDLCFAFGCSHGGDCISFELIDRMKPLFNLSESLSDGVLRLSDCKKTKSLAENIAAFSRMRRKELSSASKYCKNVTSPHDSCLSFRENTERICDRLKDDLKNAEISERLNCDYLTWIRCVMEGLVRMSENAMGFELCRAIYPCVRQIAVDARNAVSDIDRLRHCCTN